MRPPPSPPTSWALIRAWFDIGTQSIGGGTSTLFMMRRVLVERLGWVTLREFTEAYALSQLSPGIHFVALAGLIGRRMAGARGVLLSVSGMMVPAAVITAIMTAAFGAVAAHPLAIAALAGIGPVAAGMTLGLAFILARPMVQHGPRGALDVAVVVAAFGLLLAGLGSTIVIILVSGAVGALLLGRQRPTSADAPLS